MSLNQFTESVVKKNWMNINCNDIVCTTLTTDNFIDNSLSKYAYIQAYARSDEITFVDSDSDTYTSGMDYSFANPDLFTVVTKQNGDLDFCNGIAVNSVGNYKVTMTTTYVSFDKIATSNMILTVNDGAVTQGISAVTTPSFANNAVHVFIVPITQFQVNANNEGAYLYLEHNVSPVNPVTFPVKGQLFNWSLLVEKI